LKKDLIKKAGLMSKKKEGVDDISSFNETMSYQSSIETDEKVK
jgi:hypothetical protein